MVGDLPPAPREGPTTGPPSSAPRAPAFPAQPRPRAWPAIALAAIAVLLGIAALVIALTRPTSNQSTASSTASTTPSYTADQTTAAHQKLCDAYKLAARAVQIETNGTNQAFAGIATVNGAVMLENAVNNSPGLPPSERTAALALAESYSNVAATSSLASGQDPAWQSALNEANTKDAAMKKVCGAA
ncbi:hypothetical protein [Mycobacterium sp. 852002-51971_SCH5477799-a]|uniref:hypothetical protein n=1 Tax=Mycobacterium sp. 852002-51971_SCH5477799-a TaxID=1834106 RepID=UPI0009EEF8FA